MDYQGRVVGGGGKNALWEKLLTYRLTGRLGEYIIKGIYFQRYVSQMLIETTDWAINKWVREKQKEEGERSVEEDWP